MASYGKDYPDKAHDERRRPQAPQQAPTMSDAEAERYEELMAYDAMMRDVGGPVSQFADYLISRDRRY